MSRLAMHLQSPQLHLGMIDSIASSPQHRTHRIESAAPYQPSDNNLPFPSRIFVPEGYEKGYAYPLVIWMHSDASSELELDNIMDGLSRRNYIAIAPRGNLKSKGMGNRFHWGTSATECAVADDFVWACVTSVSLSMSVNLSRVFLAGFGSGGSVAQWIGLKNPQQIAGVVSMQGAFPKAPRVLSHWKQARTVPSLFIQNQGSSACSDEEMARAIKTAHRAGLRYQFVQTQTDDCDDDRNGLDVSMLEIANRFMMSIVTDTPLALGPESSDANDEIPFGWN